MTKFKKYCIYCIIGMLVVSLYPLYMGVHVLFSMLTQGTVQGENYPKYIIPYTPVCLAVIIAVLVMPFFIKRMKKFALLVSSVSSLGIFFLSELLLESKVIVTSNVSTTLESWQMYMCYVPPEEYSTRTWKAVDILIGEYSPAFKIHFYFISVILILSILNCLYGFGQVLYFENRTRLRALVVQTVCTALFLGLCIFACFTAFFRNGDLTVSAISALLMSLFFVIFGVTAGVYVASFLLGRRRGISVFLPSIIAVGTTFMMYLGEMILLSRHLYRFGSGFFFEGLGRFVFAPADIVVILCSGIICAGICGRLNQKTLAFIGEL